MSCVHAYNKESKFKHIMYHGLTRLMIVNHLLYCKNEMLCWCSLATQCLCAFIHTQIKPRKEGNVSSCTKYSMCALFLIWLFTSRNVGVTWTSH